MTEQSPNPPNYAALVERFCAIIEGILLALLPDNRFLAYPLRLLITRQMRSIRAAFADAVALQDNAQLAAAPASPAAQQDEPPQPEVAEPAIIRREPTSEAMPRRRLPRSEAVVATTQPDEPEAGPHSAEVEAAEVEAAELESGQLRPRYPARAGRNHAPRQIAAPAIALHRRRSPEAFFAAPVAGGLRTS